jgi:hypothetical protein
MENRSAQPHRTPAAVVHSTTPAACPRCGGFLVVDTLFDDLGPHWETGDACRRCINCGSIDDAVILANRCRNHDSPPVRRRSEARSPATPSWIACAGGRRSGPSHRVGSTGAN